MEEGEAQHPEDSREQFRRHAETASGHFEAKRYKDAHQSYNRALEAFGGIKEPTLGERKTHLSVLHGIDDSRLEQHRTEINRKKSKGNPQSGFYEYLEDLKRAGGIPRIAGGSSFKLEKTIHYKLGDTYRLMGDQHAQQGVYELAGKAYDKAVKHYQTGVESDDATSHRRREMQCAIYCTLGEKTKLHLAHVGQESTFYGS